MRRAGFTLIELLIALAVLTVVLLVVGQTLATTARPVSQYVSRSELLEDSRAAGQLIADEFTSAAYLYPPGLTINMGSDYSVKDPVSASGVRTVGSNFMAFIQQPKDITVTCAVGVAPGSVAAGQPSQLGCLTFIAYYTVLRSAAVTAAGTSAGRPPASSKDGADYLLYEYRLPLNASRLSTVFQPPVSVAASTPQGTLLADYIDPAGGFALNYGLATDLWCRYVDGGSTLTYAACSSTIMTAGGANFQTTGLRAILTLRAKTSGGNTATIPTLTFSLVPRDL